MRRKKIRIVLADEQPIFREGVRTWLEAQSDMLVVGEAADGGSAVRLVKKFLPDMILMEVALRKGGFEVIRQILKARPKTKVLIVSMYDAYLTEFKSSGASGYVLKDCSHEQLLEAIRIVYGGGTYLSPSLTL